MDVNSYRMDEHTQREEERPLNAVAYARCDACGRLRPAAKLTIWMGRLYCRDYCRKGGKTK